MAMRQTPRSGGASTPRSGGASTPRHPPRSPAVVHPVYEDFRPMIEWQEDEESNSLLLIHLPGFQRENLKVSTEGRNILRVKGETLIAGTKWSRFLEDYPLPEDCNVRGIRAKFEAGILTITIPKSKKRESSIIEEAITKPQKQPTPAPAPPPPPAPAPALAPAPLKKTEQDLDAGPISTGIPSAKKARAAGIISPDDQTISKEDEKEVPKKSLKEKPEEKEEGIKKTPEKKSEEQSSNNNNNNYPKGPSTTAQKIKNVPDQEIKKSSPGDQVKDIPKEDKQKLEKKDEADQKILDETNKERTTSSSSISRKRDYMETVRKFMDLNEERQLVVNVGAAVLVIVAFGVYLSYTVS